MANTKKYYTDLIVSSFTEILRRSARSESSGIIDTKLNLFTGQDFPTDDPIKGPATIYSWIQGRGLESLAVHCRWLQKDQAIDGETRDRLTNACLKQLKITLEAGQDRSI